MSFLFFFAVDDKIGSWPISQVDECDVGTASTSLSLFFFVCVVELPF